MVTVMAAEFIGGISFKDHWWLSAVFAVNKLAADMDSPSRGSPSTNLL